LNAFHLDGLVRKKTSLIKVRGIWLWKAKDVRRMVAKSSFKSYAVGASEIQELQYPYSLQYSGKPSLKQRVNTC
jgi:hypothetical protein